MKENKLWYNASAADWNEAMPLGNGILGMTVFITAATGYKTDLNPKDVCRDTINKAISAGYDELRRDTVEYFSEMMGRATISFPESGTKSDVPTNLRLAEPENDIGLTELYYNFGRYLLISPTDGKQVTVCASPTMDASIIRELFEFNIEAAEVLGRDADFVKELKEKVEKLPPLRIGQLGQIMEWSEDFEEFEPGHRNISNLYGLHPGNEIRQSTPELFAAARKTIERRLAHGGGHQGWSCAWIINFFARLADGNAAHENFLALLKNSTLPDAWPAGEFKGFIARGGLTVSAKWEKGKVVRAEVIGKDGQSFRVKLNGKMIEAVGKFEYTA